MIEKNHDELEEVVEEATEDTLEEVDLEVVEGNQTDKIKTLQTKLHACQTEKSEHLDNLQRAKAEFLNVKKRLEEEKLQAIGRTENAVIEQLLPLCDSFAMAMSNTAVWEAVDAEWRTGVESIHSQLQAILNAYSVTTYGASGEEFDPELHEAMGNEATDAQKADTILSVIQSGYKRTQGDTTQIIRPARVIVGIHSN